jgi:3',5'-cyclic AMP phosphodiesterase CpdA
MVRVVLALALASGAAVFAVYHDTRLVADDSNGDDNNGNGAASAQSEIVVGPYVQNVTSKQAVVCWATRKREATLTGPAGQQTTVPGYQVHEVLLSDLEPNTRYEYDVLGDGSDNGSGSFVTFPEEHQPYRFVVAGDTRSNHATHRRIVDRIVAEDPLFVINTGDLVSDGCNIHDWEEFFRINHTLMRNIPYYPVLGNHENNSQFYFDFFNLPQNERYYMFAVGDALFIMLDVEGFYYDTPAYMDDAAKEVWWSKQNLGYMRRQKAWVKDMLELHDSAIYIFVFLHEPLISVKGSRVEDAKARRTFWDGLFEQHRTSVVFTGHDHMYHRAIVDGTHHITTAGGGAPLYDPDTPAPETVVINKVNHYCNVDVGERDAKITVIDVDGNLIDQVHLDRRR